MVPSLELVGPPYGVKDVFSRLESEVVCVIQAESAACLLKLLWRDALERGLRSHGHEQRQLDWAMGQSQVRGSRSSGLRFAMLESVS